MPAQRPSPAPDELEPFESFLHRHVGTSEEEQAGMLKVLGYESLDALIDAAVPGSVRSLDDLDLPPAASEHQVLAELRRLASSNVVAEPMIGLGYSGTVTPGVIRRNILESPAWYTAYTPYQPEISQGRLEALLNFQTMVADLTGLDTANASLLDEGTAVAEAVTLMRRRSTAESDRVVVDADCHPQTIAVLETRLAPLGIELDVVDLDAGAPEGDFFGLVQQYPGSSGAIRDFAELTELAHARGALVTVAADLLALTLLTPPGEWGADVVVGSSQRFGVPLWYGGPHAAFMAVRAGSSGTCPAAWSACRSMRRIARPTGWPCRPASSTSDERRRRRTSARRRCCWRWWRRCTRCTTARRACGASPAASTVAPRDSRGASERAGFALRPPGVLRHHRRRRPRPGGRRSSPRAQAQGVLLRLIDDDHVGISCGETTTAVHVGDRARGLRRRRRRGSRGRADDALPESVACAAARSSRTRSSPSITPRRRCCGTCASWPTGTSLSTGG